MTSNAAILTRATRTGTLTEVDELEGSVGEAARELEPAAKLTATGAICSEWWREEVVAEFARTLCF
jgi:hypothetical protein